VKIIVRNNAPWDGSYDIGEFDELTVREWGWLKRFAGIHPSTMVDGLRNTDAELIAVLAVIGLHRANRITPEDAAGVFERFGDGPLASNFDLDLGDPDPDDGDASPPPPNSTARSGSSGDGSPMSSATSANPLNGSGSPGSASSPYAPATWGT